MSNLLPEIEDITRRIAKIEERNIHLEPKVFYGFACEGLLEPRRNEPDYEVKTCLNPPRIYFL